MAAQDSRASLRNTKFGHMTIGQVMEKHVQSAHKDDSAEMVASLMMVEGFGAVPIVDEGNKLIGMISEFDLLNALRKGRELTDVTVAEIMTPNPVSVTQGTDVLTAIDVFQNNHLIRIPVVDTGGKLIGIAARRDILRGYLNSHE